MRHESRATTPALRRGGILSPLLANIALSVLDEHVMAPWKPDGVMGTTYRRHHRRAKGLPTWRIVRYADDFLVLVHGQKHDVASSREDVADVLTPLGLRFSESKNRVVSYARLIRLPRFPHPVETQTGNTDVVRLHVHRRPPVPGGEGEDPCPDTSSQPSRHGCGHRQD
ncbi:reverse transcriptase domain-containing protein [Nocardia sp. CY41]|uniref:reverse transcriptase domain-containing protein n=1 Tax=Nocardia sp. CY41 TaxID=2608686 RepID=UPI001EFF2695|nr:reverse transcriptase domain-containing protein [Nocardia sp. CY41]